MKKILSLILALTMLLALCVCLSSCRQSTEVKDVGEYMDFGAKYAYEYEYDALANGAQYGSQTSTRTTFIFYKNGTGEYKYYYKSRYIDYEDIEEPFSIESYTTEFEWRVASNGAVYLFKKKTTYNDEDTRTDPSETSLPTKPIYFADEFMVHQLGDAGTSRYYIKEGSKLEKTLDEVEK